MAVVDFLRYILSNPYIILGLFIVYCIVYAISIVFSGPKPGRNPLSAGHVKPAKQLITDHNLRNKILKQRFKQQKVPDNIDTIVVGSGIGGLTTAVLLGRAGYKVLVLEKHDQAGGCCHTFLDKGFEFDTGIHYIGKMMDGDMTRILTDQITEGQVVWCPMDKEFDTVALGPSDNVRYYPMRSGTREEFMENLKKQFPEEKVAIEKWMQLLTDCRGAFMGVIIPKVLPKWLAQIAIRTGIYQLIMYKFMRLTKLTVKQAVDDLTENVELKACLAYIFGDMGVMPSEFSMMGHATLMNHYIPGAFYPLGGTSEIAFQIIPIIERYGGRVLVDAPVTKILFNEKGRANGVCVNRGNGDVEIMARRIISDAGVMNTFKHLLPKEIAMTSPLYKMIDNEIQPSISCLTTFIGLDGSNSELNLKSGNFWCFRTADFEKELREFIALPLHEAVEGEIPLMYISNPSAKDPSWEEKYPGKSVVLVITVLPWHWFSEWEDEKVKHRSEEYNTLKNKIGDQLWKQLQQMFPQLQGKMEYIDTGSPLSNKYYLGQPVGEMYGLDHNMQRWAPEVSMELRADVGIPGLYMTGQDVLTCGFSGAMHAGLLTASAILHRNLFKDLENVTKEMRIINTMKKTE